MSAQLDRVVEGIREGLVACTEADESLGLTWSVSIGDDDVAVGALGWLDLDDRRPVGLDSIFRISSMTQPITAVAALVLVDRGVIALADAVDAWLPELADRQVLRHPAGSLDDTVAADRSVTVEDLLSFRLGLGLDFSDWSPTPIGEALAAQELNAGPPQPALPPEPDEWMRRLATLPLQYQPGTRWLYDLSADVLGMLVARSLGRPLDEALQELVVDPLGMDDTGFWVPADRRHRFGPCWSSDDQSERIVFDPVDGQWSERPAFPAGSAGLVSTLDDHRRFTSALRRGGELDGVRLLSNELVHQMTADRLTEAQRAVGPSFDGSGGWGLGLGVQARDGDGVPAGAYGWDGGLGSSWRTDPATGVTVTLLTNRAWTSPEPPAVRDVVIGALAAAAAEG